MIGVKSAIGNRKWEDDSNGRDMVGINDTSPGMSLLTMVVSNPTSAKPIHVVCSVEMAAAVASSRS